MNRRDFFGLSLKSGLALMASSGLNPISLLGASTQDDPHFFLQILIPGGLDFSYLLDARSMDLTSAGLRINPLGVAPEDISFANGARTLATKLYDPLLKFKNEFSVIQGIHMSPSFDGHEQNMNLFMTGNPFGGDCFIPHLNLNKTPLDAIINSKIPATIHNDSQVIPLSGKAIYDLKKTLLGTNPLTSNSFLFRALRRNYRSNEFKDIGRFDQAVQLLDHSLSEQENIYNQFSRIPEASSEISEIKNFLRPSLKLLQEGSTNSLAIIISNPDSLIVDSHSYNDTQNIHKLMSAVVSRLVDIFSTLKETPFNDSKSFMDVTTFIIGTEFGRTNKQLATDISKSGTDHNAFNNLCLIGGKGIRKNILLGASDLHSSQEILSAAHTTFDPHKLKIFGKPFDFTAQKTLDILPATYNPSSYITSSSVINTLYKSFGVHEKYFWKNGRDLKYAETLDSILN